MESVDRLHAHQRSMSKFLNNAWAATWQYFLIAGFKSIGNERQDAGPTKRTKPAC